MNETEMTHRVMQAHCAAWRYFAALSLPAFGLMLWLPLSLFSPAIALVFLAMHYFCWRLWLDERLFALLINSDDPDLFDRGLRRIWPGKNTVPRSWESRWQGTRTLFFRAGGCLLLLWLLSFAALFIALW
ncbi:hypothetical protein EDF81_4328 [Enterobacter sp. BIGb0383]|uniref:hypothetical protein n=1 Tax=unclassified Enterobacter TaxID=2608935 RepID=UPI000F46EC14|nr:MULTISPECIES: hypothetical protein [unclassified Enterobacter]ROP50101.1 hypothetical protein EDF81_4328 [Enterobacter sp. BIGb0383]ROS06156.1 hypothetical protein EC848_3479 [Enterobacter sp. BIGb0359]